MGLRFGRLRDSLSIGDFAEKRLVSPLAADILKVQGGHAQQPAARVLKTVLDGLEATVDLRMNMFVPWCLIQGRRRGRCSQIQRLIR